MPGAPAKMERFTTKNGVAYLQTGSGSKAGPGQFTVRVGENSVRRVVEETASEPCNLRFKLHKEKDGLIASSRPGSGSSRVTRPVCGSRSASTDWPARTALSAALAPSAFARLVNRVTRITV